MTASVTPSSPLVEFGSSTKRSKSARSLPLTYRRITSAQTISLRHIALWPDYPATPQGQLDPSWDYAEDTIHLGAFISELSPEEVVGSGLGLGDEYLPPSLRIGQGGEVEADDTIRAGSSAAKEQEPIGILSLARPNALVPSSLLSEAFTSTPMSISSRDHSQAQDAEELRVTDQIQLRKFAIHPSLQGRGIGRQFLVWTLSFLRDKYDVAEGLASASASASASAASTTAHRGNSSGQAKSQGHVLVQLDARVPQRHFYEKCGMRVLDPQVFYKKSPSGEGEGMAHLKMGCLL